MNEEISKYFPRNKSSLLSVYHTGYQFCKSGHSYGPAIRDHYLLHFILSGSGTYYVGEKSYRLEAGQGFLIEPFVSTVYQADSKTPWEYCWIGFNGKDAKAYLDMTLLSHKDLMFTYKKDEKVADFFREISDMKIVADLNELAMLSRLFYFFSLIKKEKTALLGENLYVEKAIEYMNKNYSYNISISEIAEQLGLNRSYFYKLFMKKLGLSPQQYLLETRLEKACEMLCEVNFNITEISYSCGFSDPAHFSAIYKKKFGYSPKKYREGYLAQIR